MFDVLVIGCGPAGVSAALTLKSQQISVGIASLVASPLTLTAAPLLVYGSANRSGEDLFYQGIHQAKAAGIAWFEQQVTGLAHGKEGFVAYGKTQIEASCVVLATGKAPTLSLPDFAKNASRLHWRAEEAGFLYRNRVVGVIGHGAYAHRQAALLAQHARSVTLFTNQNQPEISPLWTPHQLAALSLVEEQEHLQHVHLQDGTRLIMDGLFLADRIATAADLCAGVHANTQNGIPITDAGGMCTAPGLFAAGDCANSFSCLQERVYDGYRVACTVGTFLKK